MCQTRSRIRIRIWIGIKTVPVHNIAITYHTLFTISTKFGCRGGGVRLFTTNLPMASRYFPNLTLLHIGWYICQDEERRLSTELENMLDVMTSAEEQEEEEAGQS